MERYSDYWESICQIYLLTKHYLLLAEEISDEFDTFLQPVKEHRDVLDHIVRVYGYKFLESKIEDIDKYRIQNMKKALGHSYRAFFDTADWLSYVCRQKIRLAVQGKTYDELKTKYAEYEQMKLFLRDVPQRIASVRENKDVSDNMNEIIKEIEEYKNILDILLKYYADITNLSM